MIPLRQRARRVAGGGGSRPRLAAIACAAGVAGALLAQPLQAAASGQANSSYEGAFASADPTGYQPTPGTWSLGDNVEYDFSVTNTTMLPAMLSFTVYAQRITNIDGHDVSLGQPAVAESVVLNGSLSGDDPATVGNPVSILVLPGTSMPFAQSFPVSQCGYWLVWAGQSGQPYSSGASSVLNAGATRVTGCPVPSRTPRPTPAPRTVHHTTRATPEPNAQATPTPSSSPKPSKPHRGQGWLPIGAFPPDSGSSSGSAPYGLSYGVDAGPPGIDMRGPLLALVVIGVAGLVGGTFVVRSGRLSALPRRQPWGRGRA